jgi:prepilin-type processing-associated H-X9-DG protein
MYLWPYIEQNALAQQNNYNNPFYVPPGTIPNTMNGLCAQHVPIYYCPSDNLTDQSQTYYARTRGNYVVNWGNSWYGQNPQPAGLAPFYHVNGDRSTPGDVKFTYITDGTANTLLMSECLMAKVTQDDDWRGDIHNDDGEFKFMTLLTPNSTSPDVFFGGWFQPTTDPLMPATAGSQEVTAARSRHIGGVNTALCDGSVRFVTNSISLNTWMALGSMNGGEVVGGNF